MLTCANRWLSHRPTLSAMAGMPLPSPGTRPWPLAMCEISHVASFPQASHHVAADDTARWAHHCIFLVLLHAAPCIWNLSYCVRCRCALESLAGGGHLASASGGPRCSFSIHLRYSAGAKARLSSRTHGLIRSAGRERVRETKPERQAPAGSAAIIHEQHSF